MIRGNKTKDRNAQHMIFIAKVFILCLLIAGCGVRGNTSGSTLSIATQEVVSPTKFVSYPMPERAEVDDYPNPTVYPAPRSVVGTAPPFPTVMRIINEESVAQNLGVVVDENIVVLHVEPGGGADLAGVRVGDIIDSIDGIPVRGQKEKVKQYIFEIQKEPGRKMALKIIRNEGEIILEAVPRRAIPSHSELNGPTVTPVWSPNDYF